MSGFNVVVDTGFGSLSRGDTVTDPTQVSNIEGSDNSRFVVRTLPPGAAPPPPVSTTAPSYAYYVLPIASSNTLGGVLVGSGLTIDPTTGVLSVSYAYTLPIAGVNGQIGGIKPGVGMVIRADGTADVTVTSNAGATALSGLSDVQETGTVSGQYLQFDGTHWVNVTPPAVPTKTSQLTNDSAFIATLPVATTTQQGIVEISSTTNPDGSKLALTGGTLAVVGPTIPASAPLLGSTGTSALQAVTLGAGLAFDAPSKTLSVSYAYTLLPADGSTLGGVKIGSGLTMDPTTHVLSANTQSSTVAPGSQQTLGISVAGGVAQYADAEIYTPAGGDAKDVWIGSIQFRSANATGGQFKFEVWAGQPHGTGTLIQPAGAVITLGTTLAQAYSPSIYVPDATGSNAVWVRIINQSSAPISMNAQAVVLEVATSIPALTGYTPPPPYTGPPLATVNVGPGQQFTDPSTGITALAVNGTMNISDGSYYVPFDIPPTLTAQYCKFDGNECGMFAPGHASNGANVSILISHCDFGQTRGNGVTSDGKSHDIYIQAEQLTIQNSNFYGGFGTPAYGNCIKSRSLVTSISGGYVSHNNGRCLDIPDGGTLSVSGMTLTAVPGAIANFIGYANESTSNGVSNPSFNGCTLIGTRYQDTLWIQPAGCVVSFANTAQSWANPNSSPPTYVVTGNGSVTGLLLSPPGGTTLSSTPPAAPASASGW